MAVIIEAVAPGTSECMCGLAITTPLSQRLGRSGEPPSDLYTDLYIGHCATLTLLQNWTGLPLQRISSDQAGNFPK